MGLVKLSGTRALKGPGKDYVSLKQLSSAKVSGLVGSLASHLTRMDARVNCTYPGRFHDMYVFVIKC